MVASARLASKALTVTPGGEATIEVRVRNSGAAADQFNLEVLGDASAWASVEPAVIPLFPGAEGVARIKFKPPKSSSVPARAVPFAVRVRSREDSRAVLLEEGVIEVGRFNDTFAELIPRTANGSSRARTQLALDNRGNARINARLTAADPERKLNFLIAPASLTAEPGTATFAAIRVSPRQRFMVGPAKLNPYKVHVHQDGQPTITVDGFMQQEALIPKWLVPSLIALAALLIILGFLWFTLLKPAISSAATAAAAAQASAAASAAVRAESAADRASSALGSSPQNAPAAGGGATGANPVGGDAWSARLAINPSAKPLETSITVPQGGGLAVTDLVFENPNGNSGTVYLVRRESSKKDQVLLAIRLENFRDLDFHFVTPMVFKSNQTMAFSCSPDPSSSKCDAAVYYSGYFKNPPSS